MASDSGFFDRLYQGFEAEYLVVSALFGAGLEAFKLPGDFGFDLLVSNQWQATKEKKPADDSPPKHMPFPYVLQVKSRRARGEDLCFVESVDRHELEMIFSLKQEEFDLLVEDERAFLVCVLFMPRDQRKVSARPFTFWLQGKQLQAMRERQYLQPAKDAHGRPMLQLHAVYRFLRLQQRDALTEEMARILSPLRAKLESDSGLQSAFDEAIARCRSRMAEMLPDVLESNRSGAEYVSFRRRDWDREQARFTDTLTAAKMLDRRQTDMANIGMCPTVFPIHDTGIEHWLKVQKMAAGDAEA